MRTCLAILAAVAACLCTAAVFVWIFLCTAVGTVAGCRDACDPDAGVNLGREDEH